MEQSIASKVNALITVLENVSFENKAKYILKVNLRDDTQVKLTVQRQLISTTTGKMDLVHNSRLISVNCSIDYFVKVLFVAIGQFEAHEFMESFKVYGTHAYFPHDNPMLSHYGQGERLNRLIMEPWRDIVNNKTDFQIARRFAWFWLKSTPPMRLARRIDAHVVNTAETILKVTRLILVTLWTLPSFVTSQLQTRLIAQNSIDSQNSSKDKAA